MIRYRFDVYDRNVIAAWLLYGCDVIGFEREYTRFIHLINNENGFCYFKLLRARAVRHFVQQPVC